MHFLRNGQGRELPQRQQLSQKTPDVTPDSATPAWLFTGRRVAELNASRLVEWSGAAAGSCQNLTRVSGEQTAELPARLPGE